MTTKSFLLLCSCCTLFIYQARLSSLVNKQVVLLLLHLHSYRTPIELLLLLHFHALLF